MMRPRFSTTDKAAVFIAEGVGLPWDRTENRPFFANSEAHEANYYAALAEHGMTEPDPCPPSPVTAAQAKLALFNADLYEPVKTAVSQVGYEPVRIYFENATEWHIGSPYVQGLAAELGLTDEQVEGLFTAARLL
jgi:hypothetical protein